MNFGVRVMMRLGVRVKIGHKWGINLRGNFVRATAFYLGMYLKNTT